MLIDFDTDLWFDMDEVDREWTWPNKSETPDFVALVAFPVILFPLTTISVTLDDDNGDDLTKTSLGTINASLDFLR